MKAYKGFGKNMKCRGFQYEEGKEYTEDKAKLCNSGFHACEYPLDCFGYYAPSGSEYHEVELDDVSDERGNDTKVVGKRIKIGAKLDVAGLVKAAIEYTFSRATFVKGGRATGYRGAASATGDQGAASVTGMDAIAMAVGIHGRAKAALGRWIVLSEWNRDNNYAWHRDGVKCAKIDGETLKPDVWYTLRDGEIVEWDGDDE